MCPIGQNNEQHAGSTCKFGLLATAQIAWEIQEWAYQLCVQSRHLQRLLVPATTDHCFVLQLDRVPSLQLQQLKYGMDLTLRNSWQFVLPSG